MYFNNIQHVTQWPLAVENVPPRSLIPLWWYTLPWVPQHALKSLLAWIPNSGYGCQMWGFHAVMVKIPVLRDVMRCGLMEVCWQFRGTYCLHDEGRRWWLAVPLKCWHASARLCGIKSQKTANFSRYSSLTHSGQVPECTWDCLPTSQSEEVACQWRARMCHTRTLWFSNFQAGQFSGMASGLQVRKSQQICMAFGGSRVESVMCMYVTEHRNMKTWFSVSGSQPHQLHWKSHIILVLQLSWKS